MRLIRCFLKDLMVNELINPGDYIPPMSASAIGKVLNFETSVLRLPQVDIPTAHTLHGGMYIRTIMIPAGVVLTGALIKIATMLIVQGNAVVHVGDTAFEVNGYKVLSASANRKQAFFAREDTFLTMVFPTDAKTVKEAEEEFTDDAEILMSRKDGAYNYVTITGE